MYDTSLNSVIESSLIAPSSLYTYMRPLFAMLVASITDADQMGNKRSTRYYCVTRAVALFPVDHATDDVVFGKGHRVCFKTQQGPNKTYMNFVTLDDEN
jgi:hypothetical protein